VIGRVKRSERFLPNSTAVLVPMVSAAAPFPSTVGDALVSRSTRVEIALNDPIKR